VKLYTLNSIPIPKNDHKNLSVKCTFDPDYKWQIEDKKEIKKFKGGRKAFKK
jgi:hypothetical protein